MAVELIVPEVGESITEVEIGQWLVGEGEYIKEDGPVVEIESDKATVELPAPVSGNVTQILKRPGETAAVGEVIGYMEEAEAPTEKEAPAAPRSEGTANVSPEPASSSEAPPKTDGNGQELIMPAAKRLMTEHSIEAGAITGTGRGGRILKEDVQKYIDEHGSAPQAPPAQSPPQPPPESASPTTPQTGSREQTAVRMSPMRRTIASRLVEAQQTAALLTTFNEADMTAIKTIRADVQEEFQERHGVKLGFMSFFVKACTHALQRFPQVNAQIHGEEIVYFDYCDIGIAVGAGKGLVVPVLRNAENMTLAEIEKAIADFAARAQQNKIGIEELQGGTFTISNGGVYGSMLSTPIINPPQSGVLGMHAIQDRPVALNGEVVIRPMMYLALTYDHRLVDGREAVTFLKEIKERIEKPALLLDL